MPSAPDFHFQIYSNNCFPKPRFDPTFFATKCWLDFNRPVLKPIKGSLEVEKKCYENLRMWATLHHNNNASSQQNITTTIHHHKNASQKYITTTIHHHKKTSPQQYITTTAHHHNNTSPQKCITTKKITTTIHHQRCEEIRDVQRVVTRVEMWRDRRE